MIACRSERFNVLTKGNAIRVMCNSGFVVLAFLIARVSQGQEELHNLMSLEGAAESRAAQGFNQPYTFKVDDFRLLIVPSIGFEWNDNINIVRTNAEQDLILQPMLQLDASYPLTANNLLTVDVGVGYDKYVEHDHYSTLQLQSGSGLDFDVRIKDLSFNLHEKASYIQDSSQQSEIAGTASFATINNTAGLLATLDLNEITLSTGYDHENVISESGQFQSLDRATDSILASGGVKVHPRATLGLEGTVAFTAYDEMVLNNNNAYTIGGYADWRPDSFLQLQFRAGYSILQFQHTSSSIQTSAVSSWYADLNITHHITDAISYSLDAGHEVNLGVESDATEDWYVRPGVKWNVINDLTLNTSLSYEHGNQGQGNISGNLVENYNWLTATLGLSYPLMKKLSASVNYRLTVRSSNIASDEYTQNMLELQLSYRPE